MNMCCFNGYCIVKPWYCKNDFASTNQEFGQQEMAIQAGKTMEFDQHKFVMGKEGKVAKPNSMCCTER